MALLQDGFILLKLEEAEFRLVQLFHDALVISHTFFVLLLQGHGLHADVALIFFAIVLLLN